MKSVKFLIVAAILVMSVDSATVRCETPVKQREEVRSYNPVKVMGVGVVKWYNPARKFGFIEVDNGGKDLFFQLRDCQKGFVPKEGDRVQYIWVNDNKGTRAADIQPI